ncbi:hypothetical protein DPMN_181854 [Dreissena polymorpha]|uniref:Uncharacterized protein n=1 Tax=Dreissena polymorpha TaxID=45954 RepID=A0A9D4DG22_DREPO|nr:hypothetical protein DPMN_181854 [Dreissena polymorpha]
MIQSNFSSDVTLMIQYEGTLSPNINEQTKRNNTAKTPVRQKDFSRSSLHLSEILPTFKEELITQNARSTQKLKRRSSRHKLENHRTDRRTSAMLNTSHTEGAYVNIFLHNETITLCIDYEAT